MGQVTDGVSIPTQIDKIRSWCHLHDHTLLDSDIYSDEGISGKSTVNRAALNKVLDCVCSERGILVFYSLSRLARSTRDAIEISDRMGRAGAMLVSLSEALDTTTPMGVFFFQIMAALAELERGVIGARTKAAMDFKRSQGERIGTVPYGKRLAENGSTLLPDLTDLAVIAQAQTIRQSGLSLRAVASELNRLGHRTKTGRHWTHSSVLHLLNTYAKDTEHGPNQTRIPRTA